MAGHTASLNVDGILVTMPHKFTAFTQCTASSERAKMLQVVSVVRRNPDDTWHRNMLEDLAFVNAQKEQGARLEARGYSLSVCAARAAQSASSFPGGSSRTCHPRRRRVAGRHTSQSAALRPRWRAGERRVAGSH